MKEKKDIKGETQTHKEVKLELYNNNYDEFITQKR
jgi:hypothetical protein